MEVDRYYAKGAPVEELKEGTSPSSSIIVDEKNVLPEVNDSYVKKDKELPPLFLLLFFLAVQKEKKII